ncbi:MAG: RluA family pseudouridine synthase [Cyclobacteriaceae bacterium]
MQRYYFKESILFEDNDLVIINKPEYMSTLFDRSTPVNILDEAKGYVPDAQVCHRLDKETSGVLAIAKNQFAYRHMSMQFEHRQVEKLYHAVVDGIVTYNNEKVDKAIRILPNGLVKIDKTEGKDAYTIFNKVKNYRRHTLVECRPVTGRMHQIRIHLASLGSPITGDESYGGKPFYLSEYKKKYKVNKYEDERPVMGRVALHAHALIFKDLKGESHRVEAPYPKDFGVLIKQLEKFS